MSNPWEVEDVSEFQYFCCPECDERERERDAFLQHALAFHKRVTFLMIHLST